MLSSGGYYFSNSWSARPLTLWGFGSYQLQTKWSSKQAPQRGCLYCQLIAHSSFHCCTTKTRPLFCFLRDNRSLSPPPPKQARHNSSKMKTFCEHIWLDFELPGVQGWDFQLLAAAASVSDSLCMDGRTEHPPVCYLQWGLFLKQNCQKTVSRIAASPPGNPNAFSLWKEAQQAQPPLGFRESTLGLSRNLESLRKTLEIE